METSPFTTLKVLSHRDVWKNNLMFKIENETPSHCVLLDFQTARYFPVTIDVLMAVICTTRKAHHEEFYNHYINFYYEALKDELKKFNIELDTKMTLESFLKSCDYHKTFAVVYNVIVVMITMIPQEFFVDFTEDQYRDFAEGDRSKFIMKLMDEDLIYEECLIEAVESAIEYIYKLS